MIFKFLYFIRDSERLMVITEIKSVNFYNVTKHLLCHNIYTFGRIFDIVSFSTIPCQYSNCSSLSGISKCDPAPLRWPIAPLNGWCHSKLTQRRTFDSRLTFWQPSRLGFSRDSCQISASWQSVPTPENEIFYNGILE